MLGVKTKKNLETAIVLLILACIGILSARFYSINFQNSDILPNTKETRGDIPEFVRILRKARDAHDKAICDTLPEPVDQKFYVYDTGSANPSPPRAQWHRYCVALATQDVSFCEPDHQVPASSPWVTLPPNYDSWPDLTWECKSVLNARSNQ